jgi:hypothetical protein
MFYYIVKFTSRLETSDNCTRFIFSSLLSRPTNAQHTYIKNILYVVSTPTGFNASVSTAGSLILL